MIKQIRRAEQGNVLTRSIFESNFYENYRSVVVLANTKTILNAKYASKEIKNQVIRADQLIEYIRKLNKEDSAIDSSESAMEQLANYFLSKHSNCKTDYLEKYRSLIQQEQESAAKVEKDKQTSPSILNHSEESIEPICPRCGAQMTKRKATRGNNVGKEFWGCSNFPKCHGIIS